MVLNKFVFPTVLALFLVIHQTASVRVMAQSMDSNLEAAEYGDADAQFHLGMTYIEGRGQNNNHAEAGKWFREAAAQGHADATFQLGILTERGNGVERDSERALDLYHLAAEAGNADAMYTLSTRYRHGQGVPQDIEQAELWYDRAILAWEEDNPAQLEKMFLRHE